MVAVELAQPTFFGIPPAELKLVDSRTQFWPGYETPVHCYLFRYAYRFGDGQYSNVAIAGPLVHAFAADLSDLPPDDIYAVYAGWHVEHESIYEVPLDSAPLDSAPWTVPPWTVPRRRTRRRSNDLNADCKHRDIGTCRGPRWGISSETTYSWPAPPVPACPASR